MNDKNEEYNDSIEMSILKIKCFFALKTPEHVLKLINQVKIDSSVKGTFQFYQIKANLILNNLFYYSIDSFDLTDEATKEILFYNFYLLYLRDSSLIKKDEKISRFIFNGIKDFNLALNKKSKKRKPYLSAFLSIIPGLGQAYSGQYSDATLGAIPVYSFSTIAIMSYSANNKFTLFVGINTFLAFGFYFGNIYGAYKSAHRINELEFNKKINEISLRAYSLEY